MWHAFNIEPRPRCRCQARIYCVHLGCITNNNLATCLQSTGRQAEPREPLQKARLSEPHHSSPCSPNRLHWTCSNLHSNTSAPVLTMADGRPGPMRWRHCQCPGPPRGQRPGTGALPKHLPPAPAVVPSPAAGSARLKVSNAHQLCQQSRVGCDATAASDGTAGMHMGSICTGCRCMSRQDDVLQPMTMSSAPSPGPTASWKRHQCAQLMRYCSGTRSCNRAAHSACRSLRAERSYIGQKATHHVPDWSITGRPRTFPKPHVAFQHSSCCAEKRHGRWSGPPGTTGSRTGAREQFTTYLQFRQCCSQRHLTPS